MTHRGRGRPKGVNLLHKDDVRKNILHCKVSNKELSEIKDIMDLRGDGNLSSLIRDAIFFYGDYLNYLNGDTDGC